MDQRQKVGAGHIMMRRREFIGIAGGAVVAWPLAASRAAEGDAGDPGFVGGFAPSMQAIIELEQAAFRQGLGETGYVEGQNVAIVYGRGEGDLDRLPELAADLAARKVDVIVTQGSDARASLAAKNATSTIPILFHTFSDPVALGLVASLARPGGNLTGVSMMRTGADAQTARAAVGAGSARRRGDRSARAPRMKRLPSASSDTCRAQRACDACGSPGPEGSHRERD